MNESIEQPPANEDAGEGGHPVARPVTHSGDTDEAFGARQADGMSLSGLYIEADDGGFVRTGPADHVIDKFCRL